MNIKKISKLFFTGVMFLFGIFLSAYATPPTDNTWTLVLDDEFTSDRSINTNIWGYGCTPWYTENQGTCCIIKPAYTYLTSTGLVNQTVAGTFTGTNGTYSYADGWIWLKPSQWRTYGYLEIQAQYPNAQGAWPAFWMLQSGWPPEIDIAEYRGTPLSYMTEAFYNANDVWSTTTVADTGNSFTGWHTYGLEWSPGTLKWYIDGVLEKTDNDSLVPSTPMYAILSGGADCSSANGTGFPNNFTIAYFRWYQATNQVSTNSIANGTYYLINRASGKYLDNLGSTANGSGVGQWSSSGSNNQKWTVSTLGSYRQLMCLTGSKYLDSLGNTTNGSIVGQWASSGSNNQQWTIQSAGGGYYYVINRANGKYVDSAGATTNGAIMVFWSSSGSNNQQWQFVSP